MPAEIRHVLFSHAEALEAVIEQWRRSRSSLPKGQVVDTKVEEPSNGGALRFVFTVQPDDSTRPPRSYEVEDLELMAALITYCKGRGVPLPMKADKKLQRFGGRLGLVLTLGAKGGEKLALD